MPGPALPNLSAIGYGFHGRNAKLKAGTCVAHTAAERSVIIHQSAGHAAVRQMARILDYAMPPRSLIDRKMFAALVLILGTAFYAALCWPAMHQRGYPPLDHYWDGMTYLWVFPVPLFTLICPPGRYARRALSFYALITAYIDGCTFVMMVPHRFNPLQGIPMMVFCGPIHLVGVSVVAWIIRFVWKALDISPGWEAAETEKGGNAVRIVSALAILGGAAMFPSVFRLCAIAMDVHEGRSRADALWADHSAYVLSNYRRAPQQIGNYEIYRYFDPDSGLWLRSEMHMEYERGYVARIQELLSAHGVPSWSHKQQLVSDADLLGMLDAKDMTPVTKYPYDLSPNVVLMRGGTLYRWGGSFSSGSNGLEVETQFGGNLGDLNYFGDATVGRLAKYPGVIFVRGGDQWIAAVSEDGWILNAAMKSQ
jgi:hypothetical protein